MKFRNVSPMGDLYLTLIGRDVAFGEVIELPDHLGEQIVGQEANWKWLDKPPAKPKKPAAPKKAAAAKPAAPAPAAPTEGGDQ